MSESNAGSWTIVRQWLHEDVVAALTVSYREDGYRTAHYVFICGKDGIVPTGQRGDYDEHDADASRDAACRAWGDGILDGESRATLKGWSQ